MGKAFDMGDAKNPTGPQCDAREACEGGVPTGCEAHPRGLWPEFTQVAGDTCDENPNMMCLKHLTYSSCLPYHARAEGGQRFL